MFNIGGIQKSTLVDFPGKIAAIVFTQGCNFRCGYCHNPELLQGIGNQNNKIHAEDFLSFLKTRIGKLDGVVITGGEPTLQSGLYNFIKAIKSMGFLVKLDTNGTNADIIKKLLDENLIDYIATDIKAPLEKYPQITNTNCNLETIKESIDLIINSNIDYEFRTTVVKSQLTYNDFEKIGQLIKGAKKYYLQKFVVSKILDNKLEQETTYTNEEFEEICELLRKYVQEVEYR